MSALLQYVPHLTRNNRVRFVRKDHPRDGQSCIVLDPLPNPSEREINQWYDVQFTDGRYLRCHERDLQLVP